MFLLKRLKENLDSIINENLKLKKEVDKLRTRLAEEEKKQSNQNEFSECLKILKETVKNQNDRIAELQKQVEELSEYKEAWEDAIGRIREIDEVIHRGEDDEGNEEEDRPEQSNVEEQTTLETIK